MPGTEEPSPMDTSSSPVPAAATPVRLPGVASLLAAQPASPPPPAAEQPAAAAGTPSKVQLGLGSSVWEKPAVAGGRSFRPVVLSSSSPAARAGPTSPVSQGSSSFTSGAGYSASPSGGSLHAASPLRPLPLPELGSPRGPSAGMSSFIASDLRAPAAGPAAGKKAPLPAPGLPLLRFFAGAAPAAGSARDGVGSSRPPILPRPPALGASAGPRSPTDRARDRSEPLRSASPQQAEHLKPASPRPPATKLSPSGGAGKPPAHGRLAPAPEYRSYWTPEEDDLLRRLVKEHGARNWRWIATHLPGRSNASCRERWYGHLDDAVKKKSWTPEEDDLILQLQQKLGNKWRQISKYLPGRTDNQVKNRYYSAMRRKSRRERLLKAHGGSGGSSQPGGRRTALSGDGDMADFGDSGSENDDHMSVDEEASDMSDREHEAEEPPSPAAVRSSAAASPAPAPTPTAARRAAQLGASGGQAAAGRQGSSDSPVDMDRSELLPATGRGQQAALVSPSHKRAHEDIDRSGRAVRELAASAADKKKKRRTQTAASDRSQPPARPRQSAASDMAAAPHPHLSDTDVKALAMARVEQQLQMMRQLALASMGAADPAAPAAPGTAAAAAPAAAAAFDPQLLAAFNLMNMAGLPMGLGQSVPFPFAGLMGLPGMVPGLFPQVPPTPASARKVPAARDPPQPSTAAPGPSPPGGDSGGQAYMA